MPGKKTSTTPVVIAVDTGGTFTDCVWIESGQVRMLKIFSTPEDPSRAIADAVKQILQPRRPLRLLHGTTVGTNAVLQRKGARVAFVTTAGFEDTIEIGRQARPKLYDLFFDRVEPLVPAELRFGVRERVTAEGTILTATNAGDLARLAERIAFTKPGAIAISLLFSFANSANERSVAEALKSLGVPLSVSHQILPEFREYERASTITVNAYLQPLMETYLRGLQNKLASSGKANVFVMQSSGGITALDSAAREPVRTVLSGPAGGVVGASAMARLSGFDRIISFDMGGTSTDVALVNGEIHATNEAEIAGLPVRVPMLDIHTVGAGGGSIARFDAGGALRVGPESAGADPGPICYGKGEQPTVTDANLLLGRLQPDAFLGGNFRLDLEHTRTVVAAWLRDHKSDLRIEEFATGMLRVVNATMEKAIRVVSIERGYDPRDFSLVAFGGAGGLHACELAASLGIPRVIVPAFPGALSAFGILVSDVIKDYSLTVLRRISAEGELPASAVQQLDLEFRNLRNQAEADFSAEGWRGKLDLFLSVDVRYHGQGFELNVPWSSKLPASFASEHKRRYGYADSLRDIELVTLRLRARLKSKQTVMEAPKAKHSLSTRSKKEEVWLEGKPVGTPIYHRESLPLGRWYPGPTVITEYSATTLVPVSMRFKVDAVGNLIIERKHAR
ncbi:MAG TPA: hydantoinase/oxoprolinase family protein [Terriglobales bacterium]|nr:hydantoinase/oxoprolinase family protein [Terriglobales bacterium]